MLTSERTERAYDRGLNSGINDRSPYILSSVQYQDAWWRKGFKEAHGIEEIEHQLNKSRAPEPQND